MHIPFAASLGPSLGVEWELELVDRETRQLRAGATDILEELSPGTEHPKAKHELFECTVELVTGVCSTVAEATADLAATVAELAPAAERRGLGLMCSGTHPVSEWSAQTISPNPRYAKLVDEMQWLARRLQIFGVHVHVGVRSPDKAVAIVNALTTYVPHLLAVSASSPYWAGSDTGLASARSKVFEALPTAGLPYQLPDWATFEDYMSTLISTGTIASIKEVWWDIRPHPTYGTVELRICDGLPTLHEVGMVAAVSQCLVDWLDSRLDAGEELPVPKSWVVRENKWRAARHGLDAVVIGPDEQVVPVRDALARMLDDLRPTAERLGCAEELERVVTVLDIGASYQRQRGVAAASGGDLTAVVDSLLAEFVADRPAVLPVVSSGPGAPGAVA